MRLLAIDAGRLMLQTSNKLGWRTAAREKAMELGLVSTIPATLVRRPGEVSPGWLWLLASAALVSGCANDQQRTRTEGAGGGAVVGALIGHLIGGRDGAIAGAVIGGGVGAAIGDQAAEKKKRYAEREDALRLAVSQSRTVAQQARETNDALRRDVAALQTSVSQLQSQQLSERSRNELAANARRSYQEANERLDVQLAAVRGEIGRQQQVIQHEQELAAQTREPSPGPALRLVSAGVDDLRTHERALERAKQQLAMLESRRAF